MCAKKISIEELKALGGAEDIFSLPWCSITKMEPNKIHTVYRIYRIPAAVEGNGVRNNQIVLDLDEYRTSLPQRYVDRLYDDEDNFAEFIKLTNFFVFRGTRKTRTNRTLAVVDTTLPTHPNGCTCGSDCTLCDCKEADLEQCPCWGKKRFANFNNYLNRIYEMRGLLKVDEEDDGSKSEPEVNNQLGLFDAPSPWKKKKLINF